jgi:dihydroorotase
MEFRGRPVLTVINGQIKMKDRKILGDPTGQPLVF